MSELPNGWTSEKLGVVVSTQKGKKPSQLSEISGSGFIPYIDIRAFERHEIRQYADPATSKICKSDDVLIVWDGARSGLVGIGKDGALGSTLAALRSEVVIPRYLYHFLRSQYAYLNSNPRGTGIPHIDPSILNEISVPIAPLNEQKRIVAKLDELLPKVEACRQRLEKIPTILKRFRQSVLKAAVTGKLTEDWRKQQMKSLSPIPTMGQLQQIEDLPDEWGAFNLGDCVHNHDAHRKPIKASDRKLRQGQYPYYGASGVIDTIDGYTHDGDFVLIGEDGANLLTRSTPLAFMTSGKIWVNNHAHVLSGKAGLLNEFLAYVINGRDLQEYITGTAQPKLNQENMNRIPVPVPPIEEQYEIVRRVSCCLDHYKKMLERNDFCLTTLERCTASILQRAFQGQLVEQNGSDEPATVLLERMKSPVNLKSEKSSPKRQKLDRRGQLTATC